jgi:hypothetical protein
VCTYIIDTCGHGSRVGHHCSGQYVVQGIVFGWECEPESSVCPSVRPSMCCALWRCNARHRQWKKNKEILKAKWKVKLAGSAKGRTDTFWQFRFGKRCGKGRSWTNLRNFFGIFLEGVRKTTKSLKIAGDWAKIQTCYLQSRKQACQPHRTARVDVFNLYPANVDNMVSS